MFEALFTLHTKTEVGTLIYRMIGFNEVYFINEDDETAVCFTEAGILIKQWNNIYEFREDFSRDCFNSDEEMMRAHYQLLIDRLGNNSNTSVNYLMQHFNIDKPDIMKYWSAHAAFTSGLPLRKS